MQREQGRGERLHWSRLPTRQWPSPTKRGMLRCRTGAQLEVPRRTGLVRRMLNVEVEVEVEEDLAGFFRGDRQKARSRKRAHTTPPSLSQLQRSLPSLLWPRRRLKRQRMTKSSQMMQRNMRSMDRRTRTRKTTERTTMSWRRMMKRLKRTARRCR